MTSIKPHNEGELFVSGNPMEFENTSLAGAHFKNVNLRSTRFVDVNLVESSFSNASLAGATFDDADFSNVTITDANLEGMMINGMPVSGMSQQAIVGTILYAKSVARISPFYAECCGLELMHSEDDHVVLASPAFQLVIVAIPQSIAASISIATPPARRESTPIKLFFLVQSIDAIRKVATRLGGALNPPESEWNFRGGKICDGHDPEGNVVQFRERTR